LPPIILFRRVPNLTLEDLFLSGVVFWNNQSARSVQQLPQQKDHLQVFFVRVRFTIVRCRADHLIFHDEILVSLLPPF